MREQVDVYIKKQVIDLLENYSDCKIISQETNTTIGQCLIEKHGFHTQIKQSSIGLSAGDGVFVRSSDESNGDIDPHVVVSFYEGNLISPWQQWVAKFKGGTDPANEWILARSVDGYILDGRPYGSDSKDYDQLKAELDNSIHIGQLINHPPKGKEPNVAYYHVIIPKESISEKAMDSIYFSEYNSRYHSKVDDIRLSVVVSTKKIKEKEELFADYGYCPIYLWPSSDFEQPTLMLPSWYYPVARSTKNPKHHDY